MTKPRSGNGFSLWFGLALALASSCVPGVNGSGDSFGGRSSPPLPGPGRESGPPPNFGAPISSKLVAKPVIGGTLLVLDDARTAVAADPDRDRVFIADYRQGEVVAEIQLQPGDEPGRVVADGEGRVHVALRAGAAVVTLTRNPTWSIASRRPVCVGPRGLAYDPGQRQIHVACSDGDLVSLPVEPQAEPVRRLKLERDLRDVVVDGGVLLVSRFRSSEVLTVDRAGNMVGRRTPGPRRTQRPFTQTTPDGNVGGGGMKDALMTSSVGWKMVPLRPGEALLLHQRGLADEVSASPGGYAGAQCGGIIESTISSVGPLGDPAPGRPLPSGAMAVDLAVSPDQRTIAIVSPGQALAARHGDRGFGPGGQVLTVDMGFIRQTPNPCDPGGTGGNFGSGEKGMAGAGGFGGSPSSPDAGAGDGGTGDGGPGDELPPPVIDFRQPTGEAVAIAYDVKGHLLVQTREPASIQVLTSGRHNVVLSHDSRADTGHDIFHTNSGAGIACASCHPEGGDDGRVWKFRNKSGVLEVRRTQNLAGGVMATAPFHWNGDLKSIAVLMDEVFVERMAGPKLDPEYVNVLGKWIDTIPAMPKLPVHDPDAVSRGKALFTATLCASCHDGPLLTNNKSADIGTGGALQVPSLRGVAWRAPFMHDGCAATLTERFTTGKCGGAVDKHGLTSKLTPAQISDLVSYVETL